jgi:hypothetical protein
MPFFLIIHDKKWLMSFMQFIENQARFLKLDEEQVAVEKQPRCTSHH